MAVYLRLNNFSGQYVLGGEILLGEWESSYLVQIDSKNQEEARTPVSNSRTICKGGGFHWRFENNNKSWPSKNQRWQLWTNFIMYVYAGKGGWKWMQTRMIVAPFMSTLVPNQNKFWFPRQSFSVLSDYSTDVIMHPPNGPKKHKC